MITINRGIQSVSVRQAVYDMTWIIDELLSLAEYFLEAASVDPLSGFLIVFGFVLIVGVTGVLGGLTVGALIDLFRPE